MTKIDFYLLDEQQSRMAFAVRLCNKLFGIGHEVFVFTEHKDQSEQLSKELWHYTPESFLANSIVDAEQVDARDNKSPIKIAHNICKDSAPLLDNDVLINLSLEVPPHFSRFKRHVEIIGDGEQVKQKLRENYSFYKQRGYPLEMHKLDQSRK